MSKVDIIIPSYNSAKYLPLAIESVIAQTYEAWTIVLVDDGSTDNTAEIAAAFQSRIGPKLQYIKQANAGLPAARNTAIRNSKSEFLALLDADDVWLPNRLSLSVAALERKPSVGLSYGLIRLIGPEGEPMGTPAGNERHAEGRIATYIYRREVQLPCPTITFRRSCVEKVGLFDETLRASEDRDLWLRIALGYEVASIPEVIALYRVSPNSMSTDPNRMLQAQLQFIQKHYGAAGCGFYARMAALSGVYRQLGEAFSLRGNPTSAFRSGARALLLNPLDPNAWRTATSLAIRLARHRA